MTLSAEGWFDWAEKLDGPNNKKWPDLNLIQGCVFHSAVGTLQGVIDVVMGPAQKSVTGVVGFSGRFVQFYSVDESPWANGSHEFNRKYLGFEFEGGQDTPDLVNEPITGQQIAAAVHILRDLAAYKGVGVEFWQRPATLIEHRELVATACPSDRIMWTTILGDLMNDEQSPDPPLGWEQARVLALEALRVANFQLGFELPELTPRDIEVLAWLAEKEQTT